MWTVRNMLVALTIGLMCSLIAAVWMDALGRWHDVGVRIAEGQRAAEWQRIVVRQCQPKPARWSPAAIRASQRGW